MRKKTIRDIDVHGKRVLVRVDFNVPFAEDGSIMDDLRIRAALPTIAYLRDHGAKVVLCSHLGRPKGAVKESLRLAPVAHRLGELLGVGVATTRDCAGPEVDAAVSKMHDGDVLVLENVRFHAEEEQNDPAFAKQLAALADVYVNDAFGTAHRAHASTEGVTHYLPSVAGFLMEKEIDYLARVVAQPERPLGAIIGGAKVSDKMAVLQNLLTKCDVLVIGGGMANTFLKAQGIAVGASLVEDDRLATAREVLATAKERDVRVLLPIDVVIADRFAADAAAEQVPVEAVREGWRILDVGRLSLDAYEEGLSGCKTIVWNGPLGVIEFPRFAEGSKALAQGLARLDAVTIIGGGETAALVEEAGLADKFDHISTGGGAFLEFLEGKELPGVAALEDA